MESSTPFSLFLLLLDLLLRPLVCQTHSLHFLSRLPICQVSPNIAHFTRASRISSGCVPVMTGNFAMFWAYAFTISLVFSCSPKRIFFDPSWRSVVKGSTSISVRTFGSTSFFRYANLVIDARFALSISA